MSRPVPEEKARPSVRTDTLSLSQELNAIAASQILASATVTTSTPPVPTTTLSTAAPAGAAPGTANATGTVSPTNTETKQPGLLDAGISAAPRLTVKTDRPIGTSGGVVTGPSSGGGGAGGGGANGIVNSVAFSPTENKFGVGAINKPTNAGVGGRLAASYDPAPLQADLVSRQGHVKVELALRILRVYEIDYRTQSFTVDAIVITEWNNPGLIGLDGAEGTRRCKEWLPRISVKNQIRTTVIGSDIVKLVDVRTGRVQLSSHQRLVVSESIDLRNYPFDRHTLSVVFRSEHNAHELELVVNKKIESTVECFGAASDGYLLTASAGDHRSIQELRAETFEMNSDRLDGLRHSELVCTYVSRSTRDPSGADGFVSCVDCVAINHRMTVYRDQSFAITNIWGVSFLLGLSLWFSFFWITGDDGLNAASAMSARISTSFMILIAAAAYRIYLAVISPRVQYRTIADTHYLVLFVFIFCTYRRNHRSAEQISRLHPRFVVV